MASRMLSRASSSLSPWDQHPGRPGTETLNYWTQGESFDDLKDHLKDLYAELSGGSMPNVRQLAELEVG